MCIFGHKPRNSEILKFDISCGLEMSMGYSPLRIKAKATCINCGAYFEYTERVNSYLAAKLVSEMDEKLNPKTFEKDENRELDRSVAEKLVDSKDNK